MRTYKPNTILACAKIAHEANRIFCLEQGDTSQTPWEDAPDWQKESAQDQVHKVFEGISPQQQHETWCAHKRATGWVYGDKKDGAASPPTHPCLVPYDELPPEQKRKDELFQNVVRAMAAVLEP